MLRISVPSAKYVPRPKLHLVIPHPSCKDTSQKETTFTFTLLLYSPLHGCPFSISFWHNIYTEIWSEFVLKAVNSTPSTNFTLESSQAPAEVIPFSNILFQACQKSEILVFNECDSFVPYNASQCSA